MRVKMATTTTTGHGRLFLDAHLTSLRICQRMPIDLARLFFFSTSFWCVADEDLALPRPP